MNVKCMLLSIMIASCIFADEGRAIAEKAYKNRTGYVQEVTKCVLLLINAKNDTTKKSFKNLKLEREKGEDFSIIQFLNPPGVKGTSLLIHHHLKKDDEQWLYLPALKRVKRISSRNKTGAFMGSEFSFEDMGNYTIDKYKYLYIKEDELEGKMCHVIECSPLYENSGYKKIKQWITSNDYLLMRSEFFDKKNTIFKVMNLLEYKRENENYIRPTKLVMKNLITKKTSVILFQETSFDKGLSESDFSQLNIQRIIK